MNDELRQPKKYDLVLGGNNPPPVDGMVLGGIEGVKHRLTSDNIQYQIKALSEAFNYGDTGLDLVIDALNNYKREVRQNAYRLLQQREETKAKDAVNNYKFWYLDKCSVNIDNEYTEKFLTKREINNFNLQDIINNSKEIAYRIRDYEYKKPYYPGSLEYLGDIKNIFNTFIEKPQAKNIKELIFGCFDSSNVIQIIVDAKKNFPNSYLYFWEMLLLLIFLRFNKVILVQF